MTADTIKTFFTYLAALAIIVGGFLIIYLTRTEASASELRLLIAGFIGAALQFLFGERVATTAAANATTSPTYVYAQPPSTVNVAGTEFDDKPPLT